ncbi:MULTISPECIES: YifB family Mg chelatase-like AAA ATPase [unclassified Campylobacter]|uniref:YifB family Mg chelatase-like AAA ATPase n=1 Tax=unclassified Campylobacter TaxID=2593542 RepID=UPI0012381D6F|nr:MULTISPECIES: YifB family Mg chelatase-like AAA ATPase [unclassified Campylobacter]KAA6225127.1 YifB family Mg chelatase-like AAA ATPase [Campylobacter sp. LR196d]KAA6226141.1 YifB family Mg chelatase-like AAA ATPase [Campylobacter sp. LR185c]KAA6228089.1 YifB family Mg chelatase-like AAA ATPase [Campylobacter sp. LR286c]KAA6231341.1 YifB family Mg chelatase-like AAA ATPase [Campylobacter sp. LR264d]KAA6231553.1 YifB family Mg chelatase-like AAA ATPase [Campylobacter sp. LR291e]
MKKLKCVSFDDNLDLIDVESVFTKGLPGFSIVGLANTAIKESVERIKAALISCDFTLPARKITINLSPSGIPKKGSHFDLAIASLILMQNDDIDEFFVLGELGLDGSIKSTNELFSLLLFLSTKLKTARVVVPKSIAMKASMIPNLEIYGLLNLDEVGEFFKEKNYEKFRVNKAHPLFEKPLIIDNEIFIENSDFKLDFLDIKGQENAKRACLIAALGMHNILFEGSPGSGKSMCAKRLVYIMPPQNLKEILLQNAYLSLNSKNCEFTKERAFRHPHHTSTMASIFGGGVKNAKIGEVALANGGVLFFDEFPHFSKQVIESLREPLQDYKIHISRVNSKTTYETKFSFIAAQNPCPCGNLFSKNLDCRCSEIEIKKYKNRISAPIMDRIDLYVAMDEISKDDKPSFSSKELSDMVLNAFKFGKKRGQKEFNGKLCDEDLKHFCILDKDAQGVLDVAISRFKLSQRGINKSLKVARSCADLDESELIKKEHLLNALSYRQRI